MPSIKKSKNSKHHENYLKYKKYYIKYGKENSGIYYKKNREEILENKRIHYRKNKLEILEKAKLYYSKNKENRKRYNKNYRIKNLETLKKRDRTYYWKNRAKIRDYKIKNSAKIVLQRKIYKEGIRQDILSHYSNSIVPKCKECGEKNRLLLTIDHINENGAKERRALGKKGGIEFYIWLKRRDYPSGYQVLCYNCNWLKRYNNKETTRSKYSKKIKIDLLSHYVDKDKKVRCSQCGEERLDLLTLDHIKGGGHIEQQKLGLKGTEYYRYLAKRNYPPGFRILCMNCNVSAARATISMMKIGV
ncbi:MAG: hypothetical protein KGH65_04585 [Candidatus Micrarchaeota archaeon]|nr:hypothetical protein [Candidatus Micrarchaeota archaeon]